MSDATDIYWDPGFADLLDTWGRDHVWLEIQALLAGAHGRVLDIACGTGAAITALANSPRVSVYGCDFSDLLIRRAKDKRLRRLVVGDGARLCYTDRAFEYSYSIGSLEHFHEKDIARFLAEARRVTSVLSFHQIPVSRTENEGWITPSQHYYNNRVDWWLPRFREFFREVHILPSGWEDDRSLGKWFVCVP